ncbi:MAG: nucleoid-associated protein [Lachnospiraceae bacterium]|nr:nucleoid-associated protein [Lachnospiraceae bacterium]
MSIKSMPAYIFMDPAKHTMNLCPAELLQKNTKGKDIAGYPAFLFMKISDIVIKKCFLCTLDPRQSLAGYNEFIPGSDDETSRYISKLILHNRQSIQSKPAVYDEDSYLMQILPDQEDSFESFVNIISEEMFTLMQENSSLMPGCGVFAWVLLEEQNVIAFFKLDYQSRLMNAVEADGRIAWKLNHNLLPGSSQRGYEFFLINLDMRRVLVSNKVHYVNHDTPVNFMAEYVLKVNLNQSEKEMLDTIDDVMLETISQCCSDDIQQKIFSYKNMMAEKVEEDGRIHMGEVAERIFSGNETAEEVCKEKLAQNRIPRIPVMVSSKTEKKLLKKHRIVTSAGIEILVPPGLLETSDVFSYSKDQEGNTIITIRDNNGLTGLIPDEITEKDI